jgi:uncharacterized protein YbbK (DUF523 family)
LLGVNCKYDGGNNANQKVLDLAKENILVPVCPEQLGGLPTPRPRSCRQGNRVVLKTTATRDFSERYFRGARETLKIIQLLNIKEAILNQRSPSCGSGKIYVDFNGVIVNGDGIAAELLKQNGVKVISEEEL